MVCGNGFLNWYIHYSCSSLPSSVIFIIVIVFSSCRHCNYQIKVPISSKFLLSHLILCFMQLTSAKKIFDLDKKRSFNEVLKT